MAERQPLVQKTTPHHQPTASPRGQSPIESLSSDPPPPGYQYAAIDPRTINVAEIRPNPIPVSYGEVPCSVICPVCHKQVTTSISYKAGPSVKWIVFYLILIGFCFHPMWLGFCLIPLCIKSCKDVVHVCPKCKTEIGKHRNSAYILL
jgi:lipopolysaccharide-induced tumor necrosis factor-alpha factor